MPLLEGLDGVQKMSKSLGNYIGINEPPEDIFGKIMSISDPLMWRYYELLSDKDLAEIRMYQEQVEKGSLHPMEVKKSLGAELVARFHGSNAGGGGAKLFRKPIPKEIDRFRRPKTFLGRGTDLDLSPDRRFEICQINQRCSSLDCSGRCARGWRRDSRCEFSISR